MGSYAAYAPAAYAPAAYGPAAYAPDSATLAAPIPVAALSQVLANPAAGPVARSFAAAASSVGAAAVGAGESWLAVLTVAKLGPLWAPPLTCAYICLPSSASGLTKELMCYCQNAQLPAHLSTG